MILEELRSPVGKLYLTIQQPDHAQWIYADWTGYPTSNNVATGAIAYLDWMRKQRLHAVLNDNRHLVGRWDSSLDWLEQKWVPHAVQCGIRYWAHLDNADAMSAQSAAALRARIKGQFEMEMFSDHAAAEQWLRARLAHQ